MIFAGYSQHTSLSATGGVAEKKHLAMFEFVINNLFHRDKYSFASKFSGETPLRSSLRPDAVDEATKRLVCSSFSI